MYYARHACLFLFLCFVELYAERGQVRVGGVAQPGRLRLPEAKALAVRRGQEASHQVYAAVEQVRLDRGARRLETMHD